MQDPIEVKIFIILMANIRKIQSFWYWTIIQWDWMWGYRRLFSGLLGSTILSGISLLSIILTIT